MMPQTGPDRPQARDPAAVASQAKLKQGMALHQEGKLVDAERLYEEVLQRHPKHFDALHLLGVIALQTRRTERGVELIGKAIELNANDAAAHINLGRALRELKRPADAVASYDRAIALMPDSAEVYSHRGNALRDLKRPADAIESYDRAIALKPDHANAYSNRGNALRDLKRPADAIASYDQAIALKPDYAEAYSNRGNALQELRRPADAIASYDRALALKPDYAEAHINRGVALRDLKRPEDAIASYDRAIALRPDYAATHYSRGVALHDLKRLEDAIASYDRAITLKPDYAEAYRNRGVALQDLKRPGDAIESYDRAIALKPDYAEAYYDRGAALQALKRPADALASYDRALALKPDYPEVYRNLGVALQDLRRPADALASYDGAIALKPNYAEAYYNRGVALQDLKRPTDALASYDRAIALKPDYVEAYWNQGLCLLQMGRLEQGWRQYEWRKKRVEAIAARAFPQPLWLGEESIAGKTLFIHCEQGLGDTIQFCRYAKFVEARGAKVILSVQDPLQGLLRQLNTTIQIIRAHETPKHFDYHCPLLSLPLALGTTLETIPAEPQYLKSDDELRVAWSARLPPKTKPRIGVVWSGSTIHKNDHNRSMELEQFLPVLGPDADWICLQKEVREKDETVLREDGRIAFFGNDLSDFRDTAALLDLMDLVVTIDTGVAHLAGAMGKPVWVLLPYNPDWRWLLDRDDSPWYPSVRLFRQAQIGDWAEVIDRVKRAIFASSGIRPGLR